MKLEYKIFLFSILLGIIVWVGDAVLGYTLFYRQSFWDALLFGPAPHTRLIAVGGVLVLGLFAARILGRSQQALQEELRYHEQTDAALQESQSRYRSLFENNHAVMLLIDPETAKIIDANPAACAYYGYTREELTRREITDINMLSEKEIFREMEQARSEKRRSFYFRHRLADGTMRDVHVYSGPIQLHGRALLYSIIHDITDRKQVEAALRQSEERFRQVVVSISDHIYVTELTPESHYRNIYISPHVVNLTGYSRENFTADWSFWPSKIIHPEDRAAAARQVAHLSRGLNSEVEYRLIQADGEIIWVRDSAIVHLQDEARMIYGVVSDITERKQTEQALRESEERFRRLNENLEQRVADRTRELSALYDVSAVASESLSLEMTLQKSLERALAAMRSQAGAIHLLDESGETLYLAIEQNMPGDMGYQLSERLAPPIIEESEPLLIPSLVAEPQLPHPPDLHTYLGVPMRARGQVIGVLNVFGSVEQQFTVEEVALLASIADQVGMIVENVYLHQRAEQAAVMEERERLSRELHDSVTQSVYSLTLFAEAAEEMIENGQVETVPHTLHRIGETAQNALKEMRLLLHELRPLDLEQEGLVGALHRRLSAVEGRVNMRARLVAEELIELPPLMEEELYRIAQEALNNALKHAEATAVTIYLRCEANQVVLEVVDDGIGFDPEFATETGGMGLQNIQNRVEKMGGSLAMNSSPAEGTRLTARIPRP